MRRRYPFFIASVAGILLLVGIVSLLDNRLPALHWARKNRATDDIQPSREAPASNAERTDKGFASNVPTGTTNGPPSTVHLLPSTLSPADFRLPTSGLQLKRDSIFGTPRFVGKRSGFLSPPTPGASPEDVLRAFLEANGRTFTLHASDVLDPENAEKTRDVVTPHNGMRSVTWRQQHEGIEIFGAHLALNLTADNRIINIQSRALHVPSLRFHDDVKVTAEEALEIAGGMNHPAFAQGYGGRGGTHGSHEKELPPPVPIWYPLDMVTVVKAWDVWVEKTIGDRLQTTDLKSRSPVTETHRLIVRADTGEVVEDINLTYGLEEAAYKVFVDDSPTPSTPGADSPTNGVAVEVSRTNVIIMAVDTNASPQGWIPDGANTLLGNNAQVYADWDDNDAPDGPTLTGTAYRVFDYPLSLDSGTRADYVEAAQVQAFYVINLFHDRLWQLGFDEAAGNFQSDNFGRGGIQGDRLRVEVQNDYTAREAGASGISAWYSGWGDGSIGRISVTCSTTPPRKDGALDAQVLVHEATHGLTSRLVGNGFGLSTTQSRGMAEGWSDFMALALLSKPSDPLDATYPFGSYVAERFMQPQHLYFGIRRFPYSTDTNKAPQTLADIDPNQIDLPPEVPMDDYYASEDADNIYNIGEVWCLALWECRSNLIERYGSWGNELMMGLIVDGLKLTPENPNLAEARDAILQADLVSHGGTNQIDLWRGFAKRGLGYGAVVPGSVATVGIVESFALPLDIAVSVTETTGDGDGYIEPGEQGELTVVLSSHEMGLSNAVGVLVFEQEKTEGTEEVLVTSSNTVFGSVIASVASTSAPPFAVDVAGDFPGNSNAWFSVAVSTDQGTFSLPFAMKIGNPNDYAPEMDAVTIEPGITNAVVSWSTGIESTGEVRYRLTTEGTEITEAASGTGTNHMVTLNGLLSGSNYVCRIVAVGTNGLTNATAEIGFRTHSYVHVYAGSTEPQELGTIDAPFKSLQVAANAAKLTGDEIRVAMGFYTSAQVEAVLDLVGSDWDLTVQGGYSPDFSERDPDFWQTVVDGQRMRRGIRLDEGAKLDVSGVTITRGSGEWGGGVHVRMSTFSATDCVISDNASTNGVNNDGGGLYAALESKINLTVCEVLNNCADFGGGVEIVSYGTSAEIINSSISGNLGALTSGGIEILLGAALRMMNCRVVNNDGTHLGGGMSILPFSEATVHNSTFAHNTATNLSNPTSDGGGGIAIAGSSSTGTLAIDGSLIWGNHADIGNDMRCHDRSDVHATDSNIGDISGTLTTSNNVISVDPLFADPANGDYHLLFGSPCIDAGSTNGGTSVDMDGEARPFGSAMDMGADEFVDADGDKMADYWETLQYGGTNATAGTEDTDGDGLDTFGEYIQQTNPHNPDTDGEGMPDGWEVTHGLNPKVDDAALDPDGDGMSNVDEFTADTNPQDADSLLRLNQFRPELGGVRIGWQGGTQAAQMLQSSGNVTGVWNTIFAVPPPTPGTNAVIVFDARAVRFYRIKASRE